MSKNSSLNKQFLSIYWKNFILSICFFLPSILFAGNISELVLPNGLKIVVKPDHRSPVAVFQIWYKVGSAYEHKGITGISHLLEHLMFKAADNILLGEGFNRLNAIGAKGNAYTSREHTFYYHILEKNHLALAFDVEAQRMQYLSPSVSEFDIEKKIIREECDTYMSNDPYLSAYKLLYQKAFKHNGYQFPISGRPEDRDILTLTKTMDWYKNNYTPDNATIVVVGDVSASEVFQLATKYFSSIKKSRQISTYYSKVTDQTNVKEKMVFVMPATTEVGLILVAFKVPSIKTSIPDWEAYALEVFAGWLESRNSYLTKALIRDKQLAHEISVIYSPMTKASSVFIFDVIPAYNVSLKQLEQAIIEGIKNIKNVFIDQKSLQKIKNQMIATEIFERDSMYTQAKIIGQAESVGLHWSEDAKYISRIKAVTVEQVKKVFKKYFFAEKEYVVIQNPHFVEK